MKLQENNLWINIKENPVDPLVIHLLADGDSVYLRGTELQPFFVQLKGEIKAFCNMNFTHWMPIPDAPIINNGGNGQGGPG